MVIDEPADISGIVEEYGLQRHIAELDEIGLTVVERRPSISDAWVDQLRDGILRVGESRADATFELDKNPTKAFTGRPSEIGHIIFPIWSTRIRCSSMF